MTKTVQDFCEELVKNKKLDHPNLGLPVSGVTSDSRQVKPGTIFVAVRGASQDGNQFVQAAEQNGAALIVGEASAPGFLKAPYLQVPNASLALARLAASFYGNPSHEMLLVGVTGTSGKTTTTYLIESILKASGHQVGLIGTVNFRFGTKVFPSTHTTPGAVELQDLLHQMKAEGCTAVVMEVSSHALKQQRTASIAFDGMVFTNLSPEHLDFHSDMEDYYQTKRLLFTTQVDFSREGGKKPAAAINRKDEFGRRLLQELEAQSDSQLEVRGFDAGEGLTVTLEGISGELSGIPIRSQLTGQFNCANIEAAVTVAQGLKIPFLAIAQGIKDLPGVPGRLERVENQRGVHLWVDYAHKPDALEKVIKTLREIRGNHRLITVFGCGGDRDRKKRPVMGRIAVAGSDQVIITSDNPRTEDPMAIIREILEGVQGYSNFTVEPDRKKAIFDAVRSAQSGDLVLIAGKGHEDYQILGAKKVHFDDREVAADAFRSY